MRCTYTASVTYYYYLHRDCRMAEGLPNDVNIEALKDSVKHEIRRELKIKEGAENLLKAAKDRKSKSQAEHIVKESSDKIEFLRLKLQDLIAQVPDDEG